MNYRTVLLNRQRFNVKKIIQENSQQMSLLGIES